MYFFDKAKLPGNLGIVEEQFLFIPFNFSKVQYHLILNSSCFHDNALLFLLSYLSCCFLFFVESASIPANLLLFCSKINIA